jgi:hypothetical protein
MEVPVNFTIPEHLSRGKICVKTIYAGPVARNLWMLATVSPQKKKALATNSVVSKRLKRFS